ncbi:MAG TPA: hypothetical protein VNN76_05995 [Bacteroidota bacterium]|nr:hypothetical protein [Bacteroidota bacterium]
MANRGILVVAVFLLCGQSALSRQYSLEFSGGISKDMRSKTSNRWNMGFVLAGAALFNTSEALALGGRIAYHSRGIDGEGWVEDMYAGSSGTYRFKEASGSQSVIEIMPLARLALSRSESPLHVSFQGGVGLFMVSESDVQITSSFTTTNSTGEQTVSFSDASLTGFGLQLALPLVFSRTVVVYPLYSLYSADGDLYHFYTLQIGFTISRR